MEEGRSGHETGRTPSDKLPAPLAAIPSLEVDESEPMEVDSESEASEDIGKDIERFRTERANAARTLYHQPRADDDTM